MRVARLYGWGDVRIEEQPLPAIGAGELLIRVEACGVCGSDALSWYVDNKAPVVLGHEPAGTVVAVGMGVDRLRPGDRVFVHHHAPCARCEECRRGLWSNCATWRSNGLDPGGFAEYARVLAPNAERDTLLLPSAIDFDTATFIEPLACCIRAVKRQGAVQVGDSALIVGLGAMGLLMVQLSRLYGARCVLGSDFNPARRARAAELGADGVLDPAAVDVGAEVRTRTAGRGADIVVVCPGDTSAVLSGLTAAAPGARVVCFTPLPPGRPLSIDQNALYFREITLTQSYSCGPDETREALRLLTDELIEVQSLVTHRVGLEGVAEALERACGKADGFKSIIYPGQ
jgi:L-iditol 2-dehydrogenase